MDKNYLLETASQLVQSSDKAAQEYHQMEQHLIAEMNARFLY